jgi:hypothetical protein
MEIITIAFIIFGVGVAFSIGVWWLEGQYYKRRRRRLEQLRAVSMV